MQNEIIQLAQMRSDRVNDFVSNNLGSVQTSTNEGGCTSCEAFDTFTALSVTYADKLSEILQPGMIVLYASAVGLLLVWRALEITIGKNPPQVLLQDFINISITATLLTGMGGTVGIIKAMYGVGLSTMSGVASLAFAVGQEAKAVPNYSGLSLLMETAETAFMRVFYIAEQLWSNGSIITANGIMGKIMAFVLIAPWFLLLVAFLAQAVVALFRMTLLAILSPFLIMCFSFNWSRSMTMSGIKTFIATIVVLFTATAALGLSVFFVEQLSGDLNYDKLRFFDTKFLLAVFIGIVGSSLMTEGVSLANSITQTALTNTAAGLMTAKTAVAAGVAAKVGMNAASMGGGKVAGAALKTAGYAGGALAGMAGASVGAKADSIKQQFYNSKMGGNLAKAGGAVAGAVSNYKGSATHQGGVSGANKAVNAGSKLANKAQATKSKLTK